MTDRSTHRPFTLVAGRVVDATGVRERQRVEIVDGVIASVQPSDATPSVPTLVPGLVDLQVNGIEDVDCNAADADAAAIDRIGRVLVAHGVTGWLPTLVSTRLDAYPARIEELVAGGRTSAEGARCLGVHLEGPFLGGHPGVHDPAAIAPIDLDFLRRLPEAVRLVTLGPERAHALDAIEQLVERNIVVALGHTSASAATMRAAADRGATMVTHCWNAMTPIHHREPGPVTGALLDDRLVVALIADGHHVHPDVMRLTWTTKPPDRIALVSDAVATDGVGRGRHRSDAADLPPRDAEGRLSGATAMLDHGLRVAVTECGVPLSDAVAAVTTVPLGLLGVSDRGRIAPGQLADVCALDDGLRPLTTIVGGRVAWRRRTPATTSGPGDPFGDGSP